MVRKGGVSGDLRGGGKGGKGGGGLAGYEGVLCMFCGSFIDSFSDYYYYY